MNPEQQGGLPSAGSSTAGLPLHCPGVVLSQIVRQPAYRLSAPNLGQSPEELDSGADFFQAEGAKAHARMEAQG